MQNGHFKIYEFTSAVHYMPCLHPIPPKRLFVKKLFGVNWNALSSFLLRLNCLGIIRTGTKFYNVAFNRDVVVAEKVVS